MVMKLKATQAKESAAKVELQKMLENQANAAKERAEYRRQKRQTQLFTQGSLGGSISPSSDGVLNPAV